MQNLRHLRLLVYRQVRVHLLLEHAEKSRMCSNVIACLRDYLYSEQSITHGIHFQIARKPSRSALRVALLRGAEQGCRTQPTLSDRFQTWGSNHEGEPHTLV